MGDPHGHGAALGRDGQGCLQVPGPSVQRDRGEEGRHPHVQTQDPRDVSDGNFCSLCFGADVSVHFVLRATSTSSGRSTPRARIRPGQSRASDSPSKLFEEIRKRKNIQRRIQFSQLVHAN